ncbi:HTH domain-containing protein [Streptomyces sp. NPDC017979]|uniref:HTH domain-containing protein n=1 Tax=Streptomyces sp. NPDC017979 TaxID=3365024 RepID=UPI00379F8154
MATNDRTRDTATTVAARRARVAQLLRDNVQQADIARRLNVSKHVVWRDVQAIERDTARPAEQAQPAAPRHRRDALARRAQEARDAMRDLETTVAAVVAARPSHVAIPTATAHAWAQQLRDHAATLLQVADDFAEYYPATATSERG